MNVRVVDSDVPVYAEPDHRAAIATRLIAGAIVQIGADFKNAGALWREIRFASGVGYVAADVRYENADAALLVDRVAVHEPSAPRTAQLASQSSAARQASPGAPAGISITGLFSRLKDSLHAFSREGREVRKIERDMLERLATAKAIDVAAARGLSFEGARRVARKELADKWDTQTRTLSSGKPTPVHPQPPQRSRQAPKAEPSTLIDKMKLVYALREKQGIDVKRFVKGETSVIKGALERGHKPEDIVRALSARDPRDAARKLGLY